MFDEHNLEILYSVLKIAALIVSIVGGIVGTLVGLKRLVPGWQKHAAYWFVALAPIIFNLAAVAAYFYWKKLLIACGLLVIGFAFQFADFARDKKPLTRPAVAWFGIQCIVFLFAVVSYVMTYYVNTLLIIIDDQGAQTHEIGKLTEKITEITGRIVDILEKLSHRQ